MRRRIHAMDLPEIRSYLIQFLDRQQLAIAAAVCRSWNVTFSAELYKRIDWYSIDDSRNPSKSAIQANADDIQVIHFRGNLPVDFPCESFMNLREIHARDTTWGYISCNHLSVFLYRNPRLHSVILDFEESVYIQSRDILEALLYCQDLRHVKLSLLTIGRREVKPFLQLFSRLESLDIKEPTILRPGSLYSWTEPFLAMKELYFEGYPEDRTGSLNIQLELARRCPQLKSLKLAMARKRDRRHIPKICEVLSTGCRLVNNLTIDTCDFSVPDHELAQILESCHNLAQFKMPSSTLGILTVRALHRIYGSLTQLNLRTSYQVPSNTIHEILTSCPRMIKLKAGYLSAHHILGTTKEAKIEEQDGPQPILRPIDWVCLEIQELSVVIQGLEDKPAEWHRQIFRQLGRLEELGILDIGGCSGWSIQRKDGLDLRLKTGLDRLANLKKLKQFRFNRLDQEMSKQDVHWVLQSWPSLEEISGRLHFEYKFRKKLEKIIDDDERIIRNDCYYYFDEAGIMTDSGESDEEGGVAGDAEPTIEETAGVVEVTSNETGKADEQAEQEIQTGYPT